MEERGRQPRLLLYTRVIIWLTPIGFLGFLTWKNFSTEIHAVIDPVNRVHRIAQEAATRLIGDPFLRSGVLSTAASSSPHLITLARGNRSTTRDRISREREEPSLRYPFRSDRATFALLPQPLPSRVLIRLVTTKPTVPYVVKAGSLTSQGERGLETIAYYHPLLEQLRSRWQELKSGNLVLWQDPDQLARLNGSLPIPLEASGHRRGALPALAEVAFAQGKRDSEFVKTPGYHSIEEFLRFLPPPETVATVNFSLAPYERLPDYRPSTTVTQLPRRLRGSYTIWTYVQDEDLNFNFTFQDINRHPGADPVTVRVSNDKDSLVFEETVPDDGVRAATEEIRPPRRLSVFLPRPTRGFYRLEVQTRDDDVFTTALFTQQQLLVFEGKVYVTDNPEYASLMGRGPHPPTTLFTNATHIIARTAHPNGFQGITTGDRTVRLRRTHRNYPVEGLSGITPITLPRNDVYLEGDGFFALAPEHLFLPTYPPVADIERLESLEGFAFVIGTIPKANSLTRRAVFQHVLDLSAPGADRAVPTLFFQGGVGGDGDVQVEFAELQTENVRWITGRPLARVLTPR